MEKINLDNVMAITINNIPRGFTSNSISLNQGKNFDWISFKMVYLMPDSLDIKKGQEIHLKLLGMENTYRPDPMKLKCLYDIPCKVLKISKSIHFKWCIIYKIVLKTKYLRKIKGE